MMDPITFDILWQRLISIMDEIDQIIVRTTFSTILSESRDFACILTDVQGRSLCQSVWSTANFSVVLPRTAKSMLDYYVSSTDVQAHLQASVDSNPETGVAKRKDMLYVEHVVTSVEDVDSLFIFPVDNK